ncbi:MAG: DUF3592 domain-containing protein [Burkholderiales bacterium]|nr:DUF3592 domain-containing protein [Burkholderiales bacterium]
MEAFFTALLLLALALPFLFVGIGNLIRVRKVSRWSTVKGVIDSADFQRPEVPSDVDTTFRPKICFSWTFNGHRYQSTRPGIHENSFDHFSESSVRKFLNQLPIGGEVLLLMDPSDPSRSVVRPGISAPRRSHYLALIAAGVILLICASTLFALQ